MQTVKLRRWGKGRQILQKECESYTRNSNLAVSSVLSPPEHAGLMSAMRK